MTNGYNGNCQQKYVGVYVGLNRVQSKCLAQIFAEYLDMRLVGSLLNFSLLNVSMFQVWVYETVNADMLQAYPA